MHYGAPSPVNRQTDTTENINFPDGNGKVHAIHILRHNAAHQYQPYLDYRLYKYVSLNIPLGYVDNAKRLLRFHSELYSRM